MNQALSIPQVQQQINLRELLQQITNDIFAGQTQMDVVFDYRLETPAYILADEQCLRNALTLLLKSCASVAASEYTPNNVPRTCVTIQVNVKNIQSGRGLFSIIIKDSYPRDSHNECRAIFPFGYRMRLGSQLATCRQLLKGLNGALITENEDVGMTEVKLVLPLTLSSTVMTMRKQSLPEMKALIISHRAIFANYIYNFMPKFPNRITTIVEAKRCLTVAGTEKTAYQTLIVDEDVVEKYLEELQDLLSFSSLMVVVLTSQPDSENVKTLQQQHYVVVIEKPILPTNFCQQLRQHWQQFSRKKEQGNIAKKDNVVMLTKPPMPKFTPRVLLVEDHRVNSIVAKMMLENLGCQVDVASNAEKALKLLQHPEIKYHLVFTDISLPDYNGFELAQRIRRLSASKRHVPIIALTGYTSDEDRQKCFASGMQDVLTKPLDVQLLAQKLARYV